MKSLLRLNPVTALILLLCAGIFSACDPVDPEPTKEEVLEDNADFNNKLIPGLGNVFYEENLLPNAASQLVSIIQYKGDTLALFGEINASKQLEYVHTAILKRKNSDQLSVTEIFSDQKLSRNYILEKGKRGRFVLEIQQYNETDYTISLVDYNWEGNTSKTVTTAYIQDGVEVDQFTSARKVNSGECWQEQLPVNPTTQQRIQYGLNEISCITQPLRDRVQFEIIEDTKDKSNSQEDKKQLDDLQEGIDAQQEPIEATSEDADWKHNEADLEIPPYTDEDFKSQRERDLKRQEEKQKERTAYLDGLSVTIENSSLTYDELTDEPVLLKLKIRPSSPITYPFPIPIFVSMNSGEFGNVRLYDPSMESVTFELYPPDLKDFENLESVTVGYGTDPQFLVNTNLTIIRIDPSSIEEFAGGNNQSGPPAKVLGTPLVVRVKDRFGRPLPNIPVQWDVTKGNGSLISDAKTDEDGIASSKWTLGNDGEQEVKVSVERRNGTLVNGAPLIFTASIKKDFPMCLQEGGRSYIFSSPTKVMSPNGFQQDLKGEIDGNKVRISYWHTAGLAKYMAVYEMTMEGDELKGTQTYCRTLNGTTCSAAATVSEAAMTRVDCE
ncbi:Ig-like domain-containing protein [Pontibacter beigongshangensis]|uniref:Ig-like domain-containing protein n=1 Tax=Pontibacter beigongshangensis TaxID=2574733 RepID=UPI00164F7B7E|nr:Ig-like domain-containing protein [Pontibacter beigongshangensis]